MELKNRLARAVGNRKVNVVCRKLMLVVVSVTSFAASSDAQVVRSPDAVSRNRLSDEFVLERISGKQSPEQISDSHAIQFLTPMLLNSSPSQIRRTMSSLGITEEQSAELKEIVNASFFSNERNVRSGISNICESEEYQSLRRKRNDPQALVDLMTDLEGRTSEAYENFFRSEVVQAMGTEFYGNLMLWVEENIKPKITSVKIDHVKRAAALNRDLFANFELVCAKHNI